MKNQREKNMKFEKGDKVKIVLEGSIVVPGQNRSLVNLVGLGLIESKIVDNTLLSKKEEFKITGFGVYETRNGIQVHINSHDLNNQRWKCKEGIWYFKNGRCQKDCESPLDIIKRIGDLPKEEFKITGPGKYRCRSGCVAVVKFEHKRLSFPWVGFIESNPQVEIIESSLLSTWRNNGLYGYIDESDFDLVERMD